MTKDSSLSIQRIIKLINDNTLKENIELIASLIKDNNQNIDILFELGIECSENNRLEAASLIFTALLPYRKNDVRIPYNLGCLHSFQGNHQAALNSYNLALDISPSDPDSLINKGNTLSQLRRYDEALFCFDSALTFFPNSPEAWMNKGITLDELHRYDEAIAHYDKAIGLRQDYDEGWSNKGNTLNKVKQYADAITHYERALSINPNIDCVYGNLLNVYMRICNWSHFEEKLHILISGVGDGGNITTPFPLLALVDDPALQKQCAEAYVAAQYPPNSDLGMLNKPIIKSNKITIGYFSADFREHPVSYLTAELFELHNKDQFTIIAFSYGQNDKSAMRLRLNKAFDQFIDVSTKTDKEIAQLARDLEIDIAVDLGGHTAESRTNIFAYRAAPIQLSYIGYLGTMGCSYFDYLIADKYIIPEKSKRFFSENIIYLPSYQANDSQRRWPANFFTRQRLGLPENVFVFACFNDTYKILPSTFDSWMRILKATEGSVLFLYADNPWAEKNLKIEAERRGVSKTRIIFGGRLPFDQYLARFEMCDLFLDTAPYNAGTIASDALWVGLPVLTIIGESFASRMGASILNALKLPELIAATQLSYETTAIELCKDPFKFEALKEKIAINQRSTQLFDTLIFTKNIEAAYTKIVGRVNAGLEPCDIYIAD